MSYFKIEETKSLKKFPRKSVKFASFSSYFGCPNGTFWVPTRRFTQLHPPDVNHCGLSDMTPWILAAL